MTIAEEKIIPYDTNFPLWWIEERRLMFKLIRDLEAKVFKMEEKIEIIYKMLEKENDK